MTTEGTLNQLVFAVYANAATWTDILARLKLDARNFIRKHLSDCLTPVMTGKELSEVMTVLKFYVEYILLIYQIRNVSHSWTFIY